MASSVAVDLAQRLRSGELRALARAASFVESQTETGRELIASLFSDTGRAMTVGITGPPGAGKSTLVAQLGKAIRRQGQTVGIIAVDPSSPFSGGALLGDRIRMQDHFSDPGVFIRSMASRGKLGGLAQSTLEMSLLFDAFGLNVILIETVGVGQDEIDIARLADVTVLVLAPGFGDEVQAMKAGIMEVADLFAINKADQPGADRLEQEIQAMQSISQSLQPSRAALIRRLIATQGFGVDELLGDMRSIFEQEGRRQSHTVTWAFRLREMLRDIVMSSVPEDEIEAHAARVASKQEDPYAALAALRQHLS